MIEDLSIFVNTHSSCADCWPMFFGQLEKHWPSRPFVVSCSNLTELACSDTLTSWAVRLFDLSRDRGTFVDYSRAKKFSSQYLMGLCAVETPYVLTLQEDFILYGDVDEAAIEAAIVRLKKSAIDSVRLIDSGRELTYSMQASVWKTHSLKMLYASIEASSPWDAEIFADNAMVGMAMTCLVQRADHLPMRGRNHRDSPVFPYVSTALVRGKWNVSEYPEILPPLLEQHGIDPSARGTV